MASPLLIPQWHASSEEMARRTGGAPISGSVALVDRRRRLDGAIESFDVHGWFTPFCRESFNHLMSKESKHPGRIEPRPDSDRGCSLRVSPQ
jgi:hypothetical protein